MQELNKEYRSLDKTTDVLSFAFEDTGKIGYNIRQLGEIYISIPKMKDQALEYGHSEARELAFLTVHGLLHLLGYDHMNADDEKVRGNRLAILSELRNLFLRVADISLI